MQEAMLESGVLQWKRCSALLLGTYTEGILNLGLKVSEIQEGRQNCWVGESAG